MRMNASQTSEVERTTIFYRNCYIFKRRKDGKEYEEKKDDGALLKGLFSGRRIKIIYVIKFFKFHTLIAQNYASKHIA